MNTTLRGHCHKEFPRKRLGGCDELYEPEANGIGLRPVESSEAVLCPMTGFRKQKRTDIIKMILMQTPPENLYPIFHSPMRKSMKSHLKK